MERLCTVVARLAERGGAAALVGFTREGAERLSYAELSERVEREAGAIAAQTPGQDGAIIALLSRPSGESVIRSLAALRANRVIAPLDTQFSDEVLAHVLDDAAPALVVCDERQAQRVNSLRPELPVSPTTGREGQATEPLPERPPAPEAIAALFYTSGTTGPPKGVPLTHGNLDYQLQVIEGARIVHSGETLLLPLPLHHVYPFVIGMLAPLALGLTLVLPRSLTGQQVLRALRESEAEAIVGVPRLYRALVESAVRRGGGAVAAAAVLCRQARRYSRIAPGRWLLRPLHRQLGGRLRLLASGGAAIDPELLLTLEGIGWEVAVGYGLTETSPLLTLNPPRSPHPESVGPAVDGTALRLVEGELQARGPGVFLGYRNLPEKSREVLDGDGWFRTGDLAEVGSDGYVRITGRVSTLIVTESGENIQPDTVEAALDAHPTIRESAVFELERRLLALLVPTASVVGGEASEQEKTMREAVAEVSRQLPSYQRVADFAIRPDPLPRTRLGKLRRHLLADLYLEARSKGPAREVGPVAPEAMDPADRELLEDEAARATWELLAERYGNRRLTPDTSPQLDLGIDSMEWIDLSLDIGRRTGVELDEARIEAVESVRDLLQAVTEAGATGGGALDLTDPEAQLSPGDRHWLEPLGTTAAALAAPLFRFDRLLMRRLFRLEVHGGGLPPQCLLAPNHLSYLDPFALAATLERARLRHTFWAGWTGAAFRNPLFRRLARLAQAIPVDQHSARASLALAAGVLGRGYDLVWFPEGARSPDGRLQPFKPGIGRVLEAHPVPVVPVLIRGSYEALPPGRLLPRRRPIRIDFVPAVDPGELEREGDGDTRAERITRGLERRMHSLLNRQGPPTR